MEEPSRTFLRASPSALPSPSTASPWRSSRTSLFYLAVASIAIQLLLPAISAVIRRIREARQQPILLLDGEDDVEEVPPTEPPPPPRIVHGVGVAADLKRHLTASGGGLIYALNVVRFLACLALLGLTMAAVVVDREESGSPPLGVLKKHRNRKKERHREDVGREEWVELGQSLFFFYTSLLSFLTITITNSRLSRRIKRHLAPLLFAAFALYFYRNVWPLCTFHGKPKDLALHRKGGDGWRSLTWWRCALLGVAGVLVPLLVPRTYEPSDPSLVPAHEQTASILSHAVSAHLTPFVLSAWKRDEIKYDELPPIADYTRAAFVEQRGISRVDSWTTERAAGETARHRHLFFGLLAVFWKELASLSLLLLARAVLGFAEPLAINKILQYVETPKGVEVRPFFWIALFFFGPLVRSIVVDHYGFVSSRLSVQVEALLSPLVLKHALRVRFVGSPSPSGADCSTSVESAPEADVVGRLNNLVGGDVSSIAGGRTFLHLMATPIQLGISVFFLYTILSWSALVGFAVMVVLLPVPGIIVGAMDSVAKNLSSASDARIQVVSEAIPALRMVKMLASENIVRERLRIARAKEMRFLRLHYALIVANSTVNFIMPLTVMISSFASYTVLQGQPLSASKIFSAISVFDGLSSLLHNINDLAVDAIRNRVSLDRVNHFLQRSELLDEFCDAPPSSSSAQDIGFKACSFTWLREAPALVVERNFRLTLDVSFVRGKINVVSGATGAGKTSLLEALLGEMHLEPSPSSSINLPRAEGIAYAPQRPWLLNATIRSNIILSSSFDADRFKKVVDACALKADLDLLAGGDMSEVGEGGINLSGGQKARIGLARAIYSSAQILLLDDVLSALDASTGQHIVKHCFGSDLVKGRTVILATHHVALVAPVTDFLLRLSKYGTVEAAGNVDRVVSEVPALEEKVAAEKLDLDALPEEGHLPAGALVVEEEKAIGKVQWASYAELIRGLRWSTVGIFIFALGVAEAGNTALIGWLGLWSRQYEVMAPDRVSNALYLWVYVGGTLIAASIYTLGYLFYYRGILRASDRLHTLLVESILNTTSRWLDITPSGRLLSRFSSDVGNIDQGLSTGDFLEMGMLLVIKFLGLVILVPLFSLSAIVVAIFAIILGELFLHAQQSVKRSMSNAKTPLHNHLNSSVAGVVSIRAYGVQDWVAETTRSRMDHWTRAATIYSDLGRWFSLGINTLAGGFVSLLAVYLVYYTTSDAGRIGWLLSLAAVFANMLQWEVQCYSWVSLAAVSLERVIDYTAPRIPQEPPSTDAGRPPAAWPTTGTISAQKLSVSYGSDGSSALSDVSFSIRSGEKIAICGRTGAGKSTLALALLRMVPTRGEVIIDGQDTNKINLSSLRTAVTIIPQDPVLLSGSVRFNLDPSGENDEAVLNDALRASGLTDLQIEDEGERSNKITLDTGLTSGGSNLSQGQRQILVLARALVRRSPIIVMDEATSSIDHATDKIIQDRIRKELVDVTVITIAHRLLSIMDYDRIMVLDQGKLVEFDSPAKLLENENGHFSSLVKSSNDEQRLREIAAGSR